MLPPDNAAPHTVRPAPDRRIIGNRPPAVALSPELPAALARPAFQTDPLPDFGPPRRRHRETSHPLAGFDGFDSTLSRQRDNVPFGQSRNVPLTGSTLVGCRKDSY